jgi:hypothetical protein
VKFVEVGVVIDEFLIFLFLWRNFWHFFCLDEEDVLGVFLEEFLVVVQTILLASTE